MGAGRRRSLFTIATVMLFAGAPVVVAWPSAGAAAPRPPVFSSSSYTSALHIMANPVPTPFVAELGRGDLPQGSGSWDASGAAAATASTYYPGLGVTGGAALVCSAGFPCPPGFPPPFPTVATAQYPVTPDASVPTGQHLGDPGGPVEAQALSAIAHAGTDRAESTASDGGVRLGGTSASAAAALAFRRQAASILHGPAAASQVRPSAADGDAVRVDELTAHTRQSFDDSGSLVSIAESTLHGVHLLGGTISIRSIATTSVARVDPTSKLATNDSHTVLGAVTAAGQPATIDERGITIGSNSVAPGLAQPFNDALGQALTAAGAQVVLLSAAKTTTATDAGVASSGQAGGILYAAKLGDPRLPGPVNAVATAVQLGQAGTLVSAAAGAVGVAGAVGAPPTVSGADETAATPLGSPASSASVAGLSQQPTASARRSAGTQPRGAARLSGKLAATTDGGLLGRVKTLYLVMTLTCLALALGTHALWWARLRRARGGSRP